MTSQPLPMTSSTSKETALVSRWELILLLLVGLVWVPTVLRCSIEWSVNAQYYYGWSVPFLAAYLAYERLGLGEAFRPPAHPVVAGLIIAVLALPQPLFRLVGEANSDWRLVSWGMACSATGISLGLLYLGGGWPAMRRYVFPILFLMTAIPWPTSVENLLVQGLMRLNAEVSAEFVSLCGVPAIAQGNVIELPTGVLGVSEACSGIRSLQSTLMASIFLGGLYRLPIFGRVILVALGGFIAFALNIVRTVFLSWQGAFHGIEATEKWHDSAGFAILGVVLVCLWLISHYLEKRASRIR
jgi:exosortase